MSPENEEARDAVEREWVRQKKGERPATGIAEEPGPEGDQVVQDRDPHHMLNNPVVDDPDLTEYPDPYETRPDPRDPALVDTPAYPIEVDPEEAEKIVSQGATSNSEPHPHDFDDEPGMGRTRSGEERAHERELRRRGA